MSQVNTNIKELRKRMGVTQEKLAEMIGIKRSLIGAYEESRAIPPTENLKKFADLFGVSLEELLSHAFDKEESRMLKFQRKENMIKESLGQMQTRQTRIFPDKRPEVENNNEAVSNGKAVNEYASNNGTVVNSNATNNSVYSSSNIINNSNGYNHASNGSSGNINANNITDVRRFLNLNGFPLEDCTVYAKPISVLQIVNGENYILETISGYIYRRVYDQRSFKNNFLLSSDLQNISSMELPVYEVTRFYKPEGYYSEQMPTPLPSFDRLKQQASQLLTEIERIAK